MTRLNIVQPGAVGWVWDSLGNELAKHLDAECIITPAAMHGADAYAVLCASAAPTMTNGALSRAAVNVNHFESDRPDRSIDFQAPALKLARAVTCLNEPARKRLADRGITATCVHLGVDIDRFFIRPRLVGEIRPTVVVGVGGRRYPNGRKGEVLIPVIAAGLAKAGATARFVFIGPADTWRPVAEDVARIPGMSVALPVAGDDYTQHPRLYSACDALLVTSFLEGGPYPPLEALACGVPVVSTPCGWMPEMVVQGTRNVTIYENPGRAVEALLDVAKNPPSPIMTRATVADTHSWPVVIRKWADLLGIPYVEGRNG